MHKLAAALLGALAFSALAADETITLDRPAFGDVPAPKVQAAPVGGSGEAPQALFEPQPLERRNGEADAPEMFVPATPQAAAPPPPAPPVLPLPATRPPLPPPIRGTVAYARENAQLRATPTPRGRSLASLPSGTVVKRLATLQTGDDRWWQGDAGEYGSGWITEREMAGE